MEQITEYKQNLNSLYEVMDIIRKHQYCSWDYLNSVLSCKSLMGDTTLWYWFGNLYVVTPETRHLKAGKMPVFAGYTYDGKTITFVTRMQVEENDS